VICAPRRSLFPFVRTITPSHFLTLNYTLSYALSPYRPPTFSFLSFGSLVFLLASFFQGQPYKNYKTCKQKKESKKCHAVHDVWLSWFSIPGRGSCFSAVAANVLQLQLHSAAAADFFVTQLRLLHGIKMS
jgi:hypothetical protein